jgi:hypothetical protein
MDIATTIDLNPWMFMARRFVTELDMDAKDVIRLQMGLLVKDLVNNSPPLDRKRSFATVKETIEKRFVVMPWVDVKQGLKDGGTGDVVWLGANKNTIFGAQRGNVYGNNVDIGQLEREYYRTRSSSRKSRTVGNRGTQTVKIYRQSILAKGAARKLLEKIKGRFGKLRAAWGVSWKFLGVKGAMPAWVSRHSANALQKGKGNFVDGLNMPQEPYFTIINSSVGIESKPSVHFLQTSFNRRTVAMNADVDLRLDRAIKGAGWR